MYMLCMEVQIGERDTIAKKKARVDAHAYDTFNKSNQPTNRPTDRPTTGLGFRCELATDRAENVRSLRFACARRRKIPKVVIIIIF